MTVNKKFWMSWMRLQGNTVQGGQKRVWDQKGADIPEELEVLDSKVCGVCAANFTVIIPV